MESIFRVIQVFWHFSIHCILFCARDLPTALIQRRNILEACGTRFAALLEDLGPTTIKLGQILSSRPDLIPPAFTLPLARLQDQLKPFSGKTALAIVEDSFSLPHTNIFSSFDLEAISAASIAQVHRARLCDGREVAVKIRRPGVEVTTERDLRLLHQMARFIGRLPGMKLMPLPELVEEIMLPIYEQLDFELEAENNRTFRKNFHRAERIAIPYLVDEFCCSNILVMEYFSGLQKIGKNSIEPNNARIVALTGLRALYRMIFIDGFVHADMHPGNLMVRGKSEVALLDMGLVVRLDKDTQKDFIDFFFALVNNQGRECARIVESNAQWLSPKYSRARLEDEMVRLIARHSALKSKDFEIASFVYQLIETQRRCGIRGSTAFMMTVLAMVVYDGICKQLYAECDFQQEARPFLIVGRYQGRPLTIPV